MPPTSWLISTSPSAAPTRRSWARDAPIHSQLALHTALRKCRSDGAPTPLTGRVPCMFARSPDPDAFWQAFHRYAGLDHDNYVVGSFGDSPEMATELADLVIAGIKRARPAWPET